MASFRVNGLEELALSFTDVAQIPDSVIDEMLNAEGDVVAAAQKRTAESMLHGKFYKGAVKNAVKKKRPEKSKDGRMMYITFDGKDHGNRIAEIAFVNEYGKTHQPARPFIQTANEVSEEEAVEKAAQVYDSYLTSKGL